VAVELEKDNVDQRDVADAGGPFSGRTVVMLYSKLFKPFEGWYLRVYNQARALVEEGYRVTIVAWDRSGSLPVHETSDGLRIRRVPIRAPEGRGPINGINVLRFNLAVLAHLLRNDFDVVHSFNVDTMLAGLAGARLRGRTAVLDLCEPDYYRGFWNPKYEGLLRLVNSFERFFAKRFDHLLVHSTYQIRKFGSHGVTAMTQIGSYPNQSLLAPGISREKRDTITVGRLGTIYANNGFEEIVVAFRRLRERFQRRGEPFTYRLFLAGHVFETYRQAFEELVSTLGDVVELRGAYGAAELPELYEKIDISLLVQGRQLFPNVTPTKLFESMARGVPVIANAIGDMGAIVEEGNCGLIVDETDPESICDGIERLGSDVELRRRMSENGIRLVRQKYSWEVVRKDFLGVYHGLCRQP
jgi:glycosyltransferase involved in cell wall biosynthesis